MAMSFGKKKGARKPRLVKKFLGVVGVDSGQLMITDPCYIRSEWAEKEFVDARIYRLKKTGQVYTYGKVPSHYLPDGIGTKDVIAFANFGVPVVGDKTMSDLEIAGEVEELVSPAKQALKGDYSYAGACETTIRGGHQLNYRMGHEGAGVVFSSGYGDGTYNVFGYFNAEGRCMKVEVIMG